ncbi:hypothetical protein CDEST_01504 [Colletotrichum destructivum]|uniref:Uncharacterized protein n=1 Tax=Colletotrichum destructivum TaxID=34406 RepID=A0AAX4HZW7_9PEZI|nr:hypothetical protein CDEST_01504 [Colletotrichum destructivum]
MTNLIFVVLFMSVLLPNTNAATLRLPSSRHSHDTRHMAPLASPTPTKPSQDLPESHGSSATNNERTAPDSGDKILSPKGISFEKAKMESRGDGCEAGMHFGPPADTGVIEDCITNLYAKGPEAMCEASAIHCSRKTPTTDSTNTAVQVVDDPTSDGIPCSLIIESLERFLIYCCTGNQSGCGGNIPLGPSSQEGGFNIASSGGSAMIMIEVSE